MPCFRLLDDLGVAVPGAEDHLPDLDPDMAVGMLTTMVQLSECDKVFNDAQRQGRISFYLTARGEEAVTVGSCAALASDDPIWPQYRELGAFLWRGTTVQQLAHHLTGNQSDAAHGRQMPMMLGAAAQHIFPVKGSLGTHLAHATGAAYLHKMRKQPRVNLAYFGDGCASTGDFPSALNIAAVHGTPTIFFCRNNGYAISTNAKEQYVSDGVAPRGLAFGMPTIRVDGNDPLAVYAATAAARKTALERGRPVLIEAMTYRLGAHSTSDDDSKYREAAPPEAGWDSERAYWEARSPIIRFGRHLRLQGLWSVATEEDVRKRARREAIGALKEAMLVGPPSYRHLYSDVLTPTPWMLTEQRAQLRQHLDRYGDEYGLPPSATEGL
tara:strand:+ start:750 stop:1898 length:1149 start_codon:yes stop_codon:yes gene_type:complete